MPAVAAGYAGSAAPAGMLPAPGLERVHHMAHAQVSTPSPALPAGPAVPAAHAGLLVAPGLEQVVHEAHARVSKPGPPLPAVPDGHWRALEQVCWQQARVLHVLPDLPAVHAGQDVAAAPAQAAPDHGPEHA